MKNIIGNVLRMEDTMNHTHNIKRKLLIPTTALMLSLSLTAFTPALSAAAALSLPAVGKSLTKSTGLNIRQAATTASKSLGTLDPGAYIEVIGEAGEFYKVRFTKDGAIGYCHKDYIRLVSQESGEVTTQSGPLNLRSRSTTSSAILAKLSKGTELPVLEVFNNGWLKVVSGKNVGYVSSDYFSLEGEKENETSAPSTNPTRNGLVALAKTYLGTLYEWGGDVVDNPNSYGFDCSHFTYQVLKAYGLMDRYRTSSAQQTWATPISRSELQPGDLVFYKNSSGKVNHVVMYIGDGLIIGANGGYSNTNTPAKAKAANAMVKIQNIDYSSRAKSYGRVPGLN